MPITNYTTSIAAEKTAAEIVAHLAKAGADQVMMTYREGRPVGVAFTIETPTGRRSFRLPVDAGPVQVVLQRQRVTTRYATYVHAERVAWRIMKDWLVAQLALIETEMARLDQVMLPYMTSDDGRTVYELFLDRQLALEAGT